MIKMWKFFLGFVVAICFLAVPPAPAADVSEGEIFLGRAVQDITPPAGTPLAGYGKRRGKKSTGIHDPVQARALSLRRGETTVIFLTADLVLIDAKLRKAVLKKIQAHHPLLDASLVLTATHNHSGTGAIGGRFWERFIMGKKQKRVFENTAARLAKTALQALESTVAVRAEQAETSIDDLLENRMDTRADGPDRLRIIRWIDKKSGLPLAHMIFMAAHPTILPASNMEISADFPGVLTRLLDQEHTGSTALFINGAAGDLRPKAPPFDDTFEKVSSYAQLIHERIRAMDFKTLPLDGPWIIKITRLKLPRVRARAGFFPVPSLIGGRVFPRHSHFQFVRMGPVFFMAFPAELTSEVGRRIERHARALRLDPIILGYANDYIGYVVPRPYYPDRNHYESQVSFYGPKLDWFMEERAREMALAALLPEEKAERLPPGTLEYRDSIPVLRVTGDAYHQGFEEGRLLSEEIHHGTHDIFSYLRSELPVPLVNRLIIRTMMLRAWKKMEPYVSYEEYLQMKGLAKGSGISLGKIKQIHALPEVYPGWCANGAYWGAATKNGRLIAIRNLDWNRKIGIHRHAAVKFLKTPGQNSYVNIGYYGFSGVLSGMNEKGISVGQIGASSTEETMKGVPMPFLLRRILSEASSLTDAENLFKKSNLTRGYNYVIADAVRREAIAVEATAKRFAVFRDADPRETAIPYSVSVKNAVFRGDPALDPEIRDCQKASKGNPDHPGLEPPAGSAYEIRYLKHGKLVQEHYGHIDPDTAEKIALEIAPGSNIQSVIYAFPEFRVANAKGDLRAAESGYTRFEYEDLQA